MKSYPSIPAPSFGMREFDAYIFDKLDGSNLRFEWQRKKGFVKAGTRTRLFDETDPQFRHALPLFHSTWAERLSKAFTDQRWTSAVVFLEYWGPTTLGGLQLETDDPTTKTLTLLDITAEKRGFLSPTDFLKLTQGWEDTARFLGHHRFEKGLVEAVAEGRFPGITFEGIVAKAFGGAKRITGKAKTNAWKQAIRERYAEKADLILNS